ncbi:MAG: lipocalin-like domain-containing protein [Lentisphaerota bacterium]
MGTIHPWCLKIVAMVAAATPFFAWAESNSVVGTWKLVSMTSRDETTGEESQTWGEHPLGFITYTAGGRMSAVLASADRPLAVESAGQATDEEQAMLFRKSFAYAGRYTLTQDGVIHHVEVAADPSWIGQDQRRLIRFEGNKLIVTSSASQTAASPHPLVFLLVWERIE